MTYNSGDIKQLIRIRWKSPVTYIALVAGISLYLVVFHGMPSFSSSTVFYRSSEQNVLVVFFFSTLIYISWHLGYFSLAKSKGKISIKSIGILFLVILLLGTILIQITEIEDGKIKRSNALFRLLDIDTRNTIDISSIKDLRFDSGADGASSIVFDLGELNSQRMYLDISVESQRALLAYIGMINPNLKISIAEYFGEIAYHDLPQERTSSFDLRRNGIHALIFSIILWLIILEFGAILSIN
jgi:hypothetical protein